MKKFLNLSIFWKAIRTKGVKVGIAFLLIAFPFSIAQSEPPSLISVLNAASFDWFPPAGSAVEIIGRNFSQETCNSQDGYPRFEPLCGVTVEVALITGRRVPVSVLQVTPNRIKALIPVQAEFKIGSSPVRFYPPLEAARIVVTRNMREESVMIGPQYFDAIDIFFLNPDSSGAPSSAGLYTKSGNGTGDGIFQRWPSFELIDDAPGKAALPGDILVTYGTGYRERRFQPGVFFGAYELKLTAPNGKSARLYAGSLPPPPGGILFVGDTYIPGLDQYNLQLPPVEWFQRSFGEELSGIVSFEVIITPSSSLIIPSSPSNPVYLPVEFSRKVVQRKKKVQSKKRKNRSSR